METREVVFLAIDGDCSIGVELFNTIDEALSAKKQYIWDNWEAGCFDRPRPANANDITDEDIESYVNRLANTSHPIYFEIGDIKVPEENIIPHQTVSLLGDGIKISPSKKGPEGYDLLIPNIGMGDLEQQVAEIAKSIPESSDAWTLIDLLRDVTKEFKQYQKENPTWQP